MNGPVDHTRGLVGRRRELARLRRLLPRTRLLTLTGAGGVGKTRLAEHAARTLAHWFHDGVEFVELADIQDGELLRPAVAAALGVDQGTVPVLLDHLADKRMLLVLDNCEHLMPACARLASVLLRGTATLRIMATSQHVLGIAGERVLNVPPLAVPDADEPARAVARSDAVRLFTERATVVFPEFQVNTTNASAVARLSQRLDGIPLAIELAAARLRTTPVHRLVDDLDDRFAVLTGGRSGALPRHQTLRATMDWSYGLCSPGERLLWTRLSMFPGGSDLDSAEAVCAGHGITREEVFGLVTGLVEKSVLTGEYQEPKVRYRMYESIRAYGRDLLPPAALRSLRARYRGYYRDFTERNRLDRFTSDMFDRFHALETELPNIRVALDIAFSRPDDVPAGLEMTSAMRAYWLRSGRLAEGRHWLERGLALISEDGGPRLHGLCTDAILATHEGDLTVVHARLREARSLAWRLRDDTTLARLTMTAGLAALSAGDGERGLTLLRVARERQRAIGDFHEVGVNLYYAATFGAADDPRHATGLAEELLELSETHGAALFRTYALLALGLTASRRNDWRRTRTLIRDAIGIMRVTEDRWGLIQCLEIMAWTEATDGRYERAARLLGATDALWKTIHTSPATLRHHTRAHERCAAQTYEALGDRAYRAAFRTGSRLRLASAVAYAFDEDPG